MKILLCDLCRESDKIYRKVNVTDADGLLVSHAIFCQECWERKVKKVLESVALVSSALKNPRGF